eukprot:362018-Chlamydomonas_euryale.AAC.6
MMLGGGGVDGGEHCHSIASGSFECMMSRRLLRQKPPSLFPSPPLYSAWSMCMHAQPSTAQLALSSMKNATQCQKCVLENAAPPAKHASQSRFDPED